jgi:hypothetical protein
MGRIGKMDGRIALPIILLILPRSDLAYPVPALFMLRERMKRMFALSKRILKSD